MKTLQQLLDEHHRSPISVAPTDSVKGAILKMQEHDIGAVLVMDKDRLVGIVSERDIARKVALSERSVERTKVKDVMIDRVRCVTTAQTVEECMALMTEHHFRHLPVLGEDGQLLAVVSIGDLVKETISQQAFLIGQLEQYIVGG